jgi:hypothetical protein
MRSAQQQQQNTQQTPDNNTTNNNKKLRPFRLIVSLRASHGARQRRVARNKNGVRVD